MSTTKRSTRVAAFLGAVLFFITSAGLSIAVVWEMMKGGDDATPPAPEQTAASCQPNATEETLSVPEVFKTETAASELQATDLSAGSGKTAKAGDCLIVKYYGTLGTSGEKFDENFTQPTAFGLTLGAGEVIKGWDEGLVGMKEGGTRRLVIPPALAYGEQGQGAIPPNSDLVFVVKLLRIKT